MHRDAVSPNGHMLLSFFAGGMVGAMAALLLAPQSTGRVRGRIVEQIRDGLRRGQQERARGRGKKGRNGRAETDEPSLDRPKTRQRPESAGGTSPIGATGPEVT